MYTNPAQTLLLCMLASNLDPLNDHNYTDWQSPLMPLLSILKYVTTCVQMLLQCYDWSLMTSVLWIRVSNQKCSFD